jgi:hypothetical protein
MRMLKYNPLNFVRWFIPGQTPTQKLKDIFHINAKEHIKTGIS